MGQPHWHLGDTFALLAGALGVGLRWAATNGGEAFLLALLLGVAYLIGRGNGAHR